MVGVLQFEVLEYRLKNEYNVDVRRTALPLSLIHISCGGAACGAGCKGLRRGNAGYLR